MSDAPFVEVAIPVPLRRLFTYRVPDGLALMPGDRVAVPFHRRKVAGFVVGHRSEPPEGVTRIMKVAGKLEADPVFPGGAALVPGTGGQLLLRAPRGGPARGGSGDGQGRHEAAPGGRLPRGGGSARRSRGEPQARALRHPHRRGPSISARRAPAASAGRHRGRDLPQRAPRRRAFGARGAPIPREARPRHPRGARSSRRPVRDSGRAGRGPSAHRGPGDGHRGPHRRPRRRGRVPPPWRHRLGQDRGLSAAHRRGPCARQGSPGARARDRPHAPAGVPLPSAFR